MLEYALLYVPLALVAGLVMGVAGSREFKRGLLRGMLNGAMLIGAMAALLFLVRLTADPSLVS